MTGNWEAAKAHGNGSFLSATSAVYLASNNWQKHRGLFQQLQIRMWRLSECTENGANSDVCKSDSTDDLLFYSDA